MNESTKNLFTTQLNAIKICKQRFICWFLLLQCRVAILHVFLFKLILRVFKKLSLL